MEAAEPHLPTCPVLRVGSAHWASLVSLLLRYGLRLERVRPGEPIPGSYWGEPEAGLTGNQVWVRDDTPLHSLLHEACHVICMPADRRQNLHTDAGGDESEENAY